MTDVETRQQVEAAVRGIATAAKTLKLYPPTSPIPRQAVETACVSLGAFLTLNPVLSLAIARDGFSWSGEPLGAGVPGVSDLADALRERGVAELDLLPGCDDAELMDFLGVLSKTAEEIRAAGGAGAALATAGIENIRATDVHLTVVDEVTAGPDEDIDEFLRQLASDPDKLAAWMAAASAGDPTTFAEGLEELASIVGESGAGGLAETLARAFMRQEPGGKDALLGLSLEPGTVRSLAERMFSHLGTGDIAASMVEGVFGKNMLSLSNAVTALPLQQRVDQVYQNVQRMLAEAGRDDKETSFLVHMVEVRNSTEPEPALANKDDAYLRVAEVATLAPDEIDRMRDETERSRRSGNAAGVKTMLALLDQQEDFELYCRSVDSLASTVPRLIESGELALARSVIEELGARESRAVQPWPELSGRLREAISRAVDQRSMSALLGAVTADPSTATQARDLIRLAGEAAGPALVREAIGQKDQGIDAAEQLLGRRLLDLLVSALPSAQWYQVGPVVRRLAREGDPRSIEAIESVTRRPDEQSRREAALALAATGGTPAVRLLGELVRDGSAEVATVAIRALGKCGTTGGAELLARRLDEIDVDGKDFPLTREIIGALARMEDPAALSVLEQLAARKALIKRGHFSDVQELTRQAIAMHAERGGVR